MSIRMIYLNRPLSATTRFENDSIISYWLVNVFYWCNVFSNGIKVVDMIRCNIVNKQNMKPLEEPFSLCGTLLVNCMLNRVLETHT